MTLLLSGGCLKAGMACRSKTVTAAQGWKRQTRGSKVGTPHGMVKLSLVQTEERGRGKTLEREDGKVNVGLGDSVGCVEGCDIIMLIEN